MNQQDNTLTINKLSRIWSDRQERYLLVQVSYTYEEAGDCQIYRLGSMTHLDQF